LTEEKPLSTLAIDATTASDDATTLRESIKPYPTSKPSCSSLMRVNVTDEEDANRSTSGSL
jgi:hypothetical protein